MFQLDINSVNSLNFLYSAAIFVFLIFTKKKHKSSTVKLWLTGYVIITICFLLLSSISIIPDKLDFIIPYTLLILGFLTIKRGILKFYEINLSKFIDLFILVFAILAFMLTPETFYFRVIAISFFLILVFVSIIISIYKVADSGAIKLLYYIAISFQIVSIVLAVIQNSENISNSARITILSIISILFSLTHLAIALTLLSIYIGKIIMDKEVLLDKMEFLSLTDDLTGIMNRRGFMNMYRVEEKRMIRYKTPVSLTLCDIDHFKKINDTYGHDFGDKVLKKVASMLHEDLRGNDILARWGGEEFILAQPETDYDQCMKTIVRIQEKIKNLKFKYHEKTVTLTLSFGYHTLKSKNIDFDQFLKLADENLYKSKKGGRDQITGSSL